MNAQRSQLLERDCPATIAKLLWCSGLLAAVTTTAAAQVRVTGSVFDSSRATPLRGALVLVDSGVPVAWTDSSGTFVLPGLARGRRTLHLQHPRLDTLGVPSLRWTLDVDRDTTVRLVTPSFDRLSMLLCGRVQQDSLIVHGRIRRMATALLQDSLEVAWSEILLEVDGSMRGRRMRYTVPLDPSGEFVACMLPVGLPLEFRVATRELDYVRSVVWSPMALPLTRMDFSTGAVRPAAGLQGVVLDANGTVVPNAQVSVDSLVVVTTSSEGAYAFDGLRPECTS